MRTEVVNYIAQRTRLRIVRENMRGLRRRLATDPRAKAEILDALDAYMKELAILLGYGEES
ncbi:hypothetical protein COCC4DRAFT_33066 [Bipolaris maydis ATCC 48331]|uniref:BHLH domain-containing protein n=2 Tax=Cochliobolus heterostrophus TaxID=5016 RepID=M2SRG9_COCH5|nr:uncharacterized protein COCC4DRAFT_33066 [Bipolaris maydis ATCC 48331]EMD87890.1 hypothetical protein COCHEDRAFT_1023211 [Bipolaris maydis C5]ENI03404.1 hypothetical protein COCC4DRAFT_33066 [Bipolaris maydis ATCC 48331]